MQLPKSDVSKKNTPKMKTPKKSALTTKTATPTNLESPGGKKNKRNRRKSKDSQQGSPVQTPTNNAPKQKNTPNKNQQNTPKNKKSPQNKNGTPQQQTQNLASELQVYFPETDKSYKHLIEQILQQADFIKNPKSLTLKFKSPEELQKKIPILEKLSVEGKNIRIQKLRSKVDSLKRTVYFLKSDPVDTEAIGKFFKAESITPIESKNSKKNKRQGHCLTFKTEELATEASKKTYKKGEVDIKLGPSHVSQNSHTPAPATKRKLNDKAPAAAAKKLKVEGKKVKVEEEEEEEEEEDDEDDDDEDDDDDDDDDEDSDDE